MQPINTPPITTRVNAIVACVGLAVGFLLLPFVFLKTLAVGEVSPEGICFLWGLSALMFVCGLMLLLFRNKVSNPILPLFLFALILLVCAEIFTRAGVKLFCKEETINQLILQSEMSYGLGLAYEGHPFTQFAGKSGITLKGNRSFGGIQPYNNFGFPDVDFEYAKPASAIRVACIGESTTADGYPVFLEDVLNENRQQQNTCYQTMCFAQPLWTTQHTMVSFLTSIVDFKPDYLVIHHGWNEAKVRNCSTDEFRNDYSHQFKSFEKPEAFDAVLIRMSVIYRLIKFSYNKTPQWMNMSGAVEKPRELTTENFTDTTELLPYKRNLETIITMALHSGIKPVLTTLPHSTDSTTDFYYSVKNIDQCNAISRLLATKYRNEILFIDLDSIITGKQNLLFIDLAHVDAKGLKLKAQLIAPAILQNAALIENRLAALPVKECRQEYLKRITQRLLNNRDWLSKNETDAQQNAVLEAHKIYMADSIKREIIE